MGRIAVLGHPDLVQGYALAGVLVIPATGAAQVRAGWAAKPDDVELVLLTPAAAAALGDRLASGGTLTAVLP